MVEFDWNLLAFLFKDDRFDLSWLYKVDLGVVTTTFWILICVVLEPFSLLSAYNLEDCVAVEGGSFVTRSSIFGML